jgi:hypothetical protein
MDAHVKKMVDEQRELMIRISRLEEFLDGKIFANLRKIDQVLMTEQLGHMRAYSGTLAKRLAQSRQDTPSTS